MIKFLPAVIFVLLIVGASFYFFRQHMATQPVSPVASLPEQISQASLNSTDSERLKILEQAVITLAQKVQELSTKQPSGQSLAPTLETRVKNLETNLVSLQGQIDQFKTSASPTPVQTFSKSPVYIPLGSTGPIEDRNYLSINSTAISIDTGNYPGYTSMQLELSMSLSESVGTGYASLYNKTDGVTVSGSEVSTTSSTSTLLTSSTFKLAGGSKTYTLQVKSSQGYPATVQNARIKVNF
jgi:hypothetical protein